MWWGTSTIPATWETKAGGFQIQGQPEQHGETPSQKKEKERIAKDRWSSPKFKALTSGYLSPDAGWAGHSYLFILRFVSVTWAKVRPPQGPGEDSVRQACVVQRLSHKQDFAFQKFYRLLSMASHLPSIPWPFHLDPLKLLFPPHLLTARTETREDTGVI